MSPSNARIPPLPPHLQHAGMACALACREACRQLRVRQPGAVLVIDSGGVMPAVFEHESFGDARAQLARLPAAAGRSAVIGRFVTLHAPDGPSALALHVEPAAGEPALFVSELEGADPFSSWTRVAGSTARISRGVVLS